MVVQQIVHLLLYTPYAKLYHLSLNSVICNYKTNAIPDAILCNNCLIRYYKLHTRMKKRQEGVQRWGRGTYARCGRADNVR